MHVVEFEKDDDRNFHIDLVSTSANLRATNYKIKTVDRLESKLIAGKIIPAIVTTTALVTGLVCLEIYKYFNKRKLEQYRNAFINLALPLFQQSEPLNPPTMKFLGKDFSLWDKIEIHLGDLTPKQLLDHFEDQYKLSVEVLSVGSIMLYMSFTPKKERLVRKISELVVEVGKVQLSKTQTWVQLHVTGTDPDGNDVEEMPEVYFYFK